MKCKDCDYAVKGFFACKPDKHVCIGVKEPFIIENTNVECTQYPNKQEETIVKDLNIDEIWIRVHEYCPNGVIGIEWSANIGFGRYELVLGDDSMFHAHTEYMDNGEDKRFTKAILKALVDKIVVED